MKTGLALATFVAVLIVSPLAVAAPSSGAAPAEAPAATAKPETVALARRYFRVIDFEGQLGSILTRLTAPDQLGARANLSEAEREAIVSSAAEAMDDAMPLMLDEAARITARTFTPTQLRDMIAFYESDSGKAIAAKTPVMPPMATQLVLTFAPIIRADVVTRACAKVDCGAEPGLKA